MASHASQLLPSPIDPEMEFLVQAIQAFLSGGVLVLPPAIHWQRLEHLADEHSIALPVAHALMLYGGSSLPERVAENMRQKLNRAAQRNLLWLSEWHRVQQVFEQAEIPVISLKGFAFAFQAYGNLSLREFTDLDLLVLPRNIPAAHKVLLRNGYRLLSALPGKSEGDLLSSPNCQLDFISETSGAAIDLHWSALHRMFPYQLDTEKLFASSLVRSFDGCDALTLSNEDLLLYLCAHGTKHAWVHLKWLCDLACHLRSASDLNWAVCIHRADESEGLKLVLRHSLLLAKQLFGISLPPVAMDYCKNKKAKRLASEAAAFLFSKNLPGQRAFLRYQLAFAGSRSEHMQILLQRFFASSEADWQKIKLPRQLHWLYFAIRPMRFLLERMSQKNAAKNLKV